MSALRHRWTPSHVQVCTAKRIQLAMLGAVMLSATAETPTLDYLFPAGGKPGTKIQVSAGGKLDPWPVQVWTDHPGLSFKAEEAKGKFTVELAANAPPGPHLVRVYNQDGASNVRCWIVGQLEEQLEKEPNNEPAKAQRVETLPATINGRLDKADDTDSFALNLKAGQWLVAAVDAYSLDSPMDPALQLVDEHGTKLALNHDGRSLDSLLAWRIEKAGTYILQLVAWAYPPKADVRLTGGESAVYRLTVTAGPYARYAIPSGIQRGHKAALRLFGWNLGATGEAIIHQIDTSHLNPRQNDLFVTAPGLANALCISVGQAPEEIEIEPNGSPDLAQPLPVPCAVNGQLRTNGDEDRYQVTAKKDQGFKVRVQSASLGSPLDAVIRIEDSKGTQLARADDSGRAEDPELEWTAPADGNYVLGIVDLLRRGGSDYVYRIEILHSVPDFKASIDSQTVKLEPGKSAELKANVARLNGFQDHLIVVADGLPEGVTSTSVSVPGKGGDVTLTLSASNEAKPANQAVRILAIVPNLDKPEVRVALVKLKGQNALPGALQINQTDHIWLTVLPKPPPPAEAKDTKPPAQ